MPDQPARDHLRLDLGWSFHLGDIAFPSLNGHGDTYMNAKAGVAWGAAAPDFDDSEWRVLDLPHDWVVEGPFDPQANPSQGYRPRGIAWYRRRLRLEETDRGRHLELSFDGVATHCTVWVNGTVVHRNWCGYTSFHIDITPFATYGDAINVIAVRVDANAMEGWWYEGGGIYRHTWLTKRAPVHIVTDGVHADPVRGGDGWRLPVSVTLANCGHDDAAVQVRSTLLDADGRPVVGGAVQALVPVLGEAEAAMVLDVPSVNLWSVDEPYLYRVHSELLVDGAVVDEVTTTCGFRTLRFDADQGFFLNGQPVKLQGTCNHQDHAGVGVAVPDALVEWRIRRLKAMGCNAYRCAHNPPSVELLDACDRLGMLVMDENRHFNCSPEYVRQLEWLVRRDRNHPSVILWSVFNEEPMQGSPVGYEMVRRMASVVRALDRTRPVTAAMNGGLFEPVNVSQAVDVVGFNYQIDSYDRFHAANPALPVTSSEDTSAFMTRGAWTTDSERCIMAEDDTQAAPWGATHRAGWRAVADREWLAGGFTWTGFDYHGEPTPHVWPVVGSFFGIMDQCGFPKTAFYLHQVQWIREPMLRIAPHWNWAGREGEPIKVMVITTLPEVELRLNHRSQGRQTVAPDGTAEWLVPYEPGTLTASAPDHGPGLVEYVETQGEPVALQLLHDGGLLGDGEHVLPVEVRAVASDDAWLEHPTADHLVTFTISGPARIIGLGNGDPTCHEPEQGWQRSLFAGRAQVIIQSTGGPGEVALTANAEGLRGYELRLTVTDAPARPAVAPEPPTLRVSRWRMSPLTNEAPDPRQVIADSDMNSWFQVRPETGCQTLPSDGWVLFRAQFTPFAAARAQGGALCFAELGGAAEVWVDGVLLGTKADGAPAPFAVTIAAGEGERTVTLRVPVRGGAPVGPSGTVEVRGA